MHCGFTSLMTDLRPGRARPRLQRRHFSTKPPRSPQLAARQLSQAPVTSEVSTGSWISAAQPRISPTLGKGEWTQSSRNCLSKHLGQLCKQSPVLFCTGKWHLPMWRVWIRVPREPASVRPSGIWAHPSPVPCVAGADRGHLCSVQPQPQHPSATCSPLLAPWGGSGDLQSSSSLIPRMLQPRPGLALAMASRAKALQGLPLALSTEPALHSSALHSSRHLHGSLRTALLLLSLQTPSSPLAFCLT